MNTLPAVERACELVELLGAGEVVDGVIDILNYVPSAPTVLHAGAGEDQRPAGHRRGAAEEMVPHPGEAGLCQVDGDQVTVPSWRADVLRHDRPGRGGGPVPRLQQHPLHPPCGARPPRAATPPSRSWSSGWGRVCRACGYDEIITYSFISPTYYDKIRWAQDDPRRQSFKILNPLGEDTSIMRTTTLPSMLEILTRNYNYPQQVPPSCMSWAASISLAGPTAWRWRRRCSLWALTAKEWTSSP